VPIPQVVSVSNNPLIFEASGPAEDIFSPCHFASYAIEGSTPQGGGVSAYTNPVTGNLFYNGSADTGMTSATPTPFNTTLDITGIPIGGPYTLTLTYSVDNPVSPNFEAVTYSGTFSVAPYINLTTPALTCGETAIVLSWTTNVGGDSIHLVKRNGTQIANVGGSTYTATSAFGATDTYTVVGDPSGTVSNAVVVSPFLCPPTWPGCEGPQLTVTGPTVAGATAYLFYIGGVLTATQPGNVYVFTGLTMEVPYSITYAVVVGGITSPQSPAGVFSPCPLCAWSPVPRSACSAWTPKPPV
jgi:hypothetical protein